MAAIDVTDATFETEVLERSKSVPVVVDLWADWCAPCKTLGPILEKVIDATGGKVVLGLGVPPKPDFWIQEGAPNTPRIHVAFRADSREAVVLNAHQNDLEPVSLH